MTVEELISMLRRLPIEDQKAPVLRLITHPGHVAAITKLEIRRTKSYEMGPDGAASPEAKTTTEVVIR